MINIKKLNLKILISVLSFTLVLTSCGIMKVRFIFKKKINPSYYTYQDKSIIFVPLMHFGQKEFYTDLKSSLKKWKNEGYTVFYEIIRTEQSYLGLDSISHDNYRRKIRRALGGNNTADYYAKTMQEVSIFKNAIAQPKYSDLGLDSTDVNTDITMVNLINKIEEYYGEIKLDSCDYSTHLDSIYNCSSGYNDKKLDPIILDYRNSIVVEEIHKSDLKKIVVVFGVAHIKGIKKLLKE